MKRLLLLVSCFLLISPVLSAQTVVVQVSSTTEFQASASHNTVVGGVPTLSNYTLTVLSQGSGTVVFGPRDLGKPTPDAGNKITVPIGWTQAQFNALTPGLYMLFVTAVGPAGSNASAPSDPFAVTAAPAAPGKPVVVR